MYIIIIEYFIIELLVLYIIIMLITMSISKMYAVSKMQVQLHYDLDVALHYSCFKYTCINSVSIDYS